MLADITVHNLKVFNKYGQIYWPGPTVLPKTKLDEIIRISKHSIEVYIDQKQKPLQGQELNKTCIGKLLINLEQKFLKQKCVQMGLNFMEYKDNILTFKIFHFTKYEFGSFQQFESQNQENQSLGTSIQSQYINHSHHFSSVNVFKQRNLSNLYEDKVIPYSRESSLRSHPKTQVSFKKKQFQVLKQIKKVYQVRLQRIRYKKERQDLPYDLEREIQQYNGKVFGRQECSQQVYRININMKVKNIQKKVSLTQIYFQNKIIQPQLQIKLIQLIKTLQIQKYPPQQDLYFTALLINILFHKTTSINFNLLNQNRFQKFAQQVFWNQCKRKQAFKRWYSLWIRFKGVQSPYTDFINRSLPFKSMRLLQQKHDLLNSLFLLVLEGEGKNLFHELEDSVKDMQVINNELKSIIQVVCQTGVKTVLF